MSTLVKIIVTSLFSLLLSSCDFGIKGNGNVVTKERMVEGGFDHIEVSRGLDVYLTQNDHDLISVQADENLHDIITTKLEGTTLMIYAEDNISSSEAKKVMVNFTKISKITASSGCEVYGTSLISLPELELEISSGANMDLDLKVSTLFIKSSSGSDLKVSGRADTLNVTASSGSDVNARHLNTLTADANAMSGADIVIQVSEQLTMNTNTGGDITYIGNPEKIQKSN